MKIAQPHSVCVQSLEYSADLSLTYFSHLQHLPWAMLLRSAAQGHPNNRFDILVANPIATLVTHAATTQITISSDAGNPIYSSQDPFELLAHYQDLLLPSLAPIDDIPFIGGALGYFSYDLGRQVETMPTTASADIPTADMAVGLYEWALVVDHQLQRAYLVGQNLPQYQQWLENQKCLYQQQVDINESFRLKSDWSSNMTKSEYGQKFSLIKEYLAAGDCYQINLAQRFNAAYQGSEWQAYQALETSNHAPFSAFIRTDEIAVLSISPERFLSLENQPCVASVGPLSVDPLTTDCKPSTKRVIETKPIKGTRPRSLDPIEDAQLAQQLQRAQKDQAENLMIVDLLRNDIGRVAKPGSVTVPALFEVESFPAVHHLVSTIRAQLDDNQTPSSLLRACFPGGSITGAPKIRAMQIIEELEPHRRNIYCGSIGYISRCGNMDSNITIRTLIAYQQHLYAWAGGGIVADSEMEAEYQETLDKVSRILPILSKV
ncbi:MULTISPECIES: chorismate-binding protein [Vibrio]|uniref:Aminodeoxychorismate synthase component I n=1 Tax=Vibrio algicola TaxID=2662262 RepID=A0A5Q0TDC2_9VIBR|nr:MULTISPECIES: chorismate-binding protein [Vibrio]MBD1577003.1 aminodeoxychorismate synthase component I [Vibrio sp. S11_S32]